MKIIIDSNIFFSALIKDSITRKLILEYDDVFLFPCFMFIELQKHRTEILLKSKMTEQSFNTLVGLLLQKIIMISDELIDKHSAQAKIIVEKIDVEDKVFIASALAHPGSVLWTNDKNLKKQNAVKIFETEDFLKFIESQKETD